MNYESLISVLKTIVFLIVFSSAGTFARVLESQETAYVYQSDSALFTNPIVSSVDIPVSSRNQGKHNVSQFGSYFEWQPALNGSSPHCMFELMPFSTGMVCGKLKASTILAMGLHLPRGISIDKEPNRFYSKALLKVGTNLHKGVMVNMGSKLLYKGRQEFETGLILELSKNFMFDNGQLPIRLIYTLLPEDSRLSIIFGYAITL